MRHDVKMKFIEALKEVEKSEAYAAWRLRNPDCFFSYAFSMFENKKESSWDIGYYNPETRGVTVFSFEGNGIVRHNESETAGKGKIEAVDLGSVILDETDAIKSMMKLKDDKMKSTIILKTVCILQSENNNAIWNMTSITKDFRTWNVKINAKTGEIIKDELIELFKFNKGKK